MADAELKLYVGATEYGTVGNPVSFASAVAGEATEHPLNPFYLWNDKGGSLGSVPAKDISIQVEHMWIVDEVMGASDGSPSQTFNTLVTPILDTGVLDDLVLKVAGVEWLKVLNFSGQLATAKVYTITTAGLVTFGDGINGAIPTLAASITLTYMPDLNSYGKSIYEGLWFGVMSFGVTPNAVSVVDESQISQSASLVTVSNTLVTAVTGIWLATDPGHTGTNYYSGGSFVAASGEITPGTPLPGATTSVLVNYSFTAIDDTEGSYTAIGEDVSHTFTNQIPQNNAKLLYFRMNIPATATPSGGSNFRFRLKLLYEQ
jgi:hypothetical protein